MIGLFTKLGATGYLAQKLLLCVVGTVTVAFVGLAGRELAGPTVGLSAAGLAAVYPFLWVVDGSLMSETLYGVFLAATLWLALRFARRPSLGLAAGWARSSRSPRSRAATRSCSYRAAPAAGVPCRGAWRPRRHVVAVALGAFVLVLAPWTIRNLTVFEQPVLISTNGSAVFVGSNCDAVYYGDLSGCGTSTATERRPTATSPSRRPSTATAASTTRATTPGRVPLVMGVRLLRVWDLFTPCQQAATRSRGAQRDRKPASACACTTRCCCSPSPAPCFLRRRGPPLWPLLAFPVIVSATAVLIYGVTRFGFAAEPALCVLAAVAVAAAASTMKTRVRAGISQSQSTPA